MKLFGCSPFSPAVRGLVLWTLVWGTVISGAQCSAQVTAGAGTDSLRYYELPAMVVTATRGERQIRNVPVSTEVLMEDDIRARGSMRLTDLLAEQAGLSIVHGFGAGLQMQGLSSGYILILIDGEPVIGRSGGILDLDRLTVKGLERVEIVRGPSSSLYGSDALGGVVNLITKESGEPISASVGMTYETHSTTDVSLSSDFSSNGISGSLLFDRYSSNGYDLLPERPGQTAPGFVDHTASARLNVKARDDTKLRLGGRFGKLDQTDPIGLSVANGLAPSASVGERTDWSATGGIDYRLSQHVALDGSLNVSRFISTTSLETTDSRFDHRQSETELKMDAVVGTSHLVTIGSGIGRERVASDRVTDGSRSSTDGFGYVHYQWLPNHALNLVVSSRYDRYSDFGSRLSPKLSALYRPSTGVSVRASIGSGFKAPTFQQRYLDFNNPTSGYRVLGANDVAAVLTELQENGEIRRYTTSVDFGELLRPEHSWSLNLGADWYASRRHDFRLNLFYNRIYDLIETLLVAEQVSGQQIFSYANLDRIRTRGIEVNLRVSPIPAIRVDLGYQFLDAADLNVLDAIDAGTIYTRENGRDRLAAREDYGGLFQRSRHAASMNLRYRLEPLGTSASIRAMLKGKYGLFDRNGNLILDNRNEYVATYMLLNITVTQRLSKKFSLQAGIKNLFDHTNPDLLPALPGRLVFGGIELRTD